MTRRGQISNIISAAYSPANVRNVRKILALFLSGVALTSHQALAASPAGTFDVASVKLSANQNAVMGIFGAPLIPSGPISTLSLTQATLHGLLMRAYDIRFASIKGPSWMDDVYYDVTAKVPAGARKQQIAEMLQKLLVERFGMRVRRETSLVNGWGLVAGPPPLRLKKTELTTDLQDFDSDGLADRKTSMKVQDRVRTITMRGTSLRGLVNGIWAEVGEPVKDLTGLDGFYDVILEGETDSSQDLMARMSAAAVKASLRRYGLDLVRQKVPTQVLWVDSANRTPKPN